MVTIYYPTHKATEIAKLYLKQPRDLPPHVTKWRAFNTSAGKDGMKQYHIIYTERGKAEEAGLEIFKYFMPFSSIEGYNIQVESVMGVTDSFKLMGMQW
ncbi:MAG: hypothetical protein ACFE9I_13320 [Candidatus Hermodarchaeota archaeon]